MKWFIIAVYVSLTGETTGTWESTQSWENIDDCEEVMQHMKGQIIWHGHEIPDTAGVMVLCAQHVN